MGCEEITQLLPELLDRNLIVEMAYADLVVGFVGLGARHLLHFGVEFRNQILLDLRLYRLIQSETFNRSQKMEVDLQKSAVRKGPVAGRQRFY